MRYATAYAVSANTRRFWELPDPSVLDCTPVDDPEQHASRLTAADGDAVPDPAAPQGGPYALPEVTLAHLRRRPGRMLSEACDGIPGNTAATIPGENTPMPQYPSLTHALAEALVDVTWFIDGTDDEQMDEDDAVTALEGVAAVVDRMSEAQRAELLDVLEAMAAAEADPRRRAFLETFPEDFGVVE